MCRTMTDRFSCMLPIRRRTGLCRLWKRTSRTIAGKYSEGWDATARTARHERLKAMGVLDDKWEIAPRDETVTAWEDAQHKEWESMRMAVYSAQVERMDQGIGKICDTLKANDVERDTVVIFLSDNGGCAEFLCEDRDNMDESRRCAAHSRWSAG